MSVRLLLVLGIPVLMGCGSSHPPGADGGDAGPQDGAAPDAPPAPDAFSPDAGGTADAAVDAYVPRTCDPVCDECHRCLDGACVPAEDGRGCGGGLCWEGACCTGCWDGIRCLAGDGLEACGARGVRCRPCPCGGDACAAGVCTPPVRATTLSAGAYHGCATLADESLWCWGRNARGQVGADSAEVILPRPARVADGVRVHDAGGEHGCALDADKVLTSWGADDRGQLGLGTFGLDRRAPAPVVATGDWVSLTLGAAFGCALESDAVLSCWGAGESGQLGQGTTEDVPVPAAVADLRFRTVGAGARHACGVAADGTLHCWGANDQAQLGLGRRGITRGQSTPTLVDVEEDWVAVTAGLAHTCALREGGQLWCWGEGEHGQLGTGSRAQLRWPWQIRGTAEWVEVDAGDRHTCALSSRGALFCWGEGADGQLGQGDPLDRLAPALVGFETDWAAVRAGLAHTCALKTVGAVYCWGEGADGRLGAGDTADHERPARVCFDG